MHPSHVKNYQRIHEMHFINKKSFVLLSLETWDAVAAADY